MTATSLQHLARGGDEVSTDSGNGKDYGVIPLSDFLQILRGVQAASSASDIYFREIEDWAVSKNTSLSFTECQHSILDDLQEAVPASRVFAKLTLALCFLRRTSRQGIAITAAELGSAWQLVRDALALDTNERPLFRTSRSAQGFLSVALCSIINNGAIDELFRLHVWEPYGERGDPRFAIHTHQVFAQSWILAGEGTEHSYEGTPVDTEAEATHATYALSWSDGAKSDDNYKLNQISSTIRNTGKLVRCVLRHSTIHKTGDVYAIDAAEFHEVVVPAHKVHATLFWFDASRGFVKDAPVLGPQDAEYYTQVREASGSRPSLLAAKVEAVRQWESHMALGRHFAERAEWEQALQSFDNASHLIREKRFDFLGTDYYRSLVLGNLGYTNRRFGRYETAKKALEKALEESSIQELRVEFSGELGVVYRLMDQIHNARDTFEKQYQLASQIGAQEQACRAIGNLGMVNYQIWLKEQDSSYLQLAIRQLTERVETARSLKTRQASDGKGGDWSTNLQQWEVVGNARLSLCLAAVGNMSEAMKRAWESLQVAEALEDSTMIAMSRFYYGRTLLQSGRTVDALRYFNDPDPCTPAIAFCKEPSEEHRGYLQELITAGANLDLFDTQGYCALDYAVFNGDKATQSMIIESLTTRHGSAEIENMITGARLRKAYREIFQEQLRPILLDADSRNLSASLRLRYSSLLEADTEKRSLLDDLKYIPYSKFISCGRIPRSNEAPLERLQANEESNMFLIFFSYRWIGGIHHQRSNHEPARPYTVPDSSDNRQYKRMIGAIERFLQLHPSLDRDSIGIWVVCLCGAHFVITSLLTTSV
jgi:tetratricopeptide (TPR) repeat protein